MDNDSKLISMVAQYQDTNNWDYTLKYHHAEINVDGVGNNSVSVPRKNLEILEASIQSNVVLGNIKIDFRYSSDGIPTLGNDSAFASAGINWTVSY